MKTAAGLPENYPDDVCLMGKGALCCSFLTVGPNGLECAKQTGIESVIRQRRKSKSMTAMGDNCEGPPNYTPREVAVQ